MAKKFGDRKDGAKLRNIHAMHLVMPLMLLQLLMS
mgnify:CR=1 FL=1